MTGHHRQAANKHQPDPRRHGRAALAILCALPFLAVGAKACLDAAALSSSAYVYADTGRPMLLNYDGYHFLRLAEMAGARAVTPAPAPGQSAAAPDRSATPSDRSAPAPGQSAATLGQPAAAPDQPVPAPGQPTAESSFALAPAPASDRSAPAPGQPVATPGQPAAAPDRSASLSPAAAPAPGQPVPTPASVPAAAAPPAAQAGASATPALAWLLAALSALGGLSGQSVALWASPLLGLSMILAVRAWSRRLAGEEAAGVAGLLAAQSPYWAEVAGLGKCQTACLVPALILCCGMCLHGFLAAAAPARGRWLACFFPSALLLGWWWRPGGYLASAMLACAMLSPAALPGRTGRRLRLVGLAAAAACLLLMVSGAYEHLPAPLAELFRYARLHIALALKTEGSQAAMGASIIELAPLTLDDLGVLSLGGVALLAAAAAGLALLLARNPLALWPLAPLLAAALLAFRSMRMTLFLFPLAAMGLGALTHYALQSRPAVRAIPSAAARSWAALAAAVLLAWPALTVNFAKQPHFTLDERTDAMALAARAASSPQAVIWSWWDYGYFLRYRTARAPFFDGGSQTADDCFVAAYPLVCPDPDLAANWMRFFAARGQGEFARLAAACGSRPRALALLHRLFSGREDPAPLMAELGGGRLDYPAAHFFPDVEVLLILPWDFWIRNGHWMAYGSSVEPPSGPVANYIDVLDADGLAIDQATGRLTLPRAAVNKGYAKMGAVVNMAAATPTRQAVDALADPILFYRPEGPKAYIASRAAARSLAFMLLAPTGFSHQRFIPVYYRPEVGGVWRVGAAASRR